MQTIYSGGGAQAVEVYARDDLGRIVRPSSATCKIVDLLVSEDADDADRIVEDTAAATVDSVSTTTTAYAGARGASPLAIALTSVASVVVGRTYVLGSAGVTEAVTVDRIDGLTVYARDALRREFSVGATFLGARVSATFPALWADDAEQLDRRAFFGVDWIFVGVTGPARVRSLATIERRGRAARATVADVLAIDEQIAEATHTRSSLERKVQQADRELTAHMIHRNSTPSEMIDGELGRLAVAFRALELAYRVLPEGTERAVWAAAEANKWRMMLLGGSKASDAVEVSRALDRVRTSRRPGIVSTIRGSS